MTDMNSIFSTLLGTLQSAPDDGKKALRMVQFREPSNPRVLPQMFKFVAQQNTFYVKKNPHDVEPMGKHELDHQNPIRKGTVLSLNLRLPCTQSKPYETYEEVGRPSLLRVVDPKAANKIGYVVTEHFKPIGMFESCNEGSYEPAPVDKLSSGIFAQRDGFVTRNAIRYFRCTASTPKFNGALKTVVQPAEHDGYSHYGAFIAKIGDEEVYCERDFTQLKLPNRCVFKFGLDMVLGWPAYGYGINKNITRLSSMNCAVARKTTSQFNSHASSLAIPDNIECVIFVVQKLPDLRAVDLNALEPISKPVLFVLKSQWPDDASTFDLKMQNDSGFGDREALIDWDPTLIKRPATELEQAKFNYNVCKVGEMITAIVDPADASKLLLNTDSDALDLKSVNARQFVELSNDELQPELTWMFKSMTKILRQEVMWLFKPVSALFDALNLSVMVVVRAYNTVLGWYKENPNTAIVAGFGGLLAAMTYLNRPDRQTRMAAQNSRELRLINEKLNALAAAQKLQLPQAERAPSVTKAAAITSLKQLAPLLTVLYLYRTKGDYLQAKFRDLAMGRTSQQSEP